MNFKNTNISQLIADTQKQLAKEKLSPAFKTLIQLLLLIIRDHFEKKSKNSRNSSIPPSQDPNRIKKNKSSTKKPGGQFGHKGVTLERVSKPDEVIPLPLDKRILPKNHSYTNAEPEKRQVMDIETKIVVKEYQAEVLIDENGKKFVRGASGLLAQIFQHETDHLNGILFIDHAKDVKEENIDHAE